MTNGATRDGHLPKIFSNPAVFRGHDTAAVTRTIQARPAVSPKDRLLEDTRMQLLLFCAGTRDKTWSGAKVSCPLRTKGKRQAQKIGCWLGRKGLRPDAVLSERTVRARVTAEKALKAAGWTANGIESSHDLSEGRVPDRQGVNRVLLVAAPKCIEAMAAQMSLETETRPGLLLIVESRNGQPHLSERVDARDLPELFPFRRRTDRSADRDRPITIRNQPSFPFEEQTRARKF